MKTALVFDWLTNLGGDIRVAKALADLYPDADIYAALYNPEKIHEFDGRKIFTSALQKLPGAKKRHQILIPLLPYTVEQYNLGKYDLVISASHVASKGILTKPETIHIDYCFTPIRYAWEPELDKRASKAGPLTKPIVKYLKTWDREAADRVDFFATISNYSAARIKKYYNRESQVIAPPVDTEKFHIDESVKQKDFYLAVGRLVPYKKFDLIVEAFNKLDKPLKIAGRGPEFNRLKKLAKSDQIEILGPVSDQELNKLYNECRAFIFPSDEDFGIVPVEAMSAGRPVIALNHGGATDTVVHGKTGYLFNNQTVESLVKAVKEFEEFEFSRKTIAEHAKRFSTLEFNKQFKKFVADTIASRNKGVIWA